MLGWEPGRVERFLREADHLSLRLGESLLDDDGPLELAEEHPVEVVAAAADAEAQAAYDLEVELELDDEEEEERVRAEDFVGAWEEALAGGLTDEVEEELAEFAEQGGVGAELEAGVEEEPTEEFEEEVDEEFEEETEVKELVLDRWRELDESAAPLEVSQSIGAPPPTSDGRPDVLVPHTPDEPLRPPGTPLAEATLDGLNPMNVRALVAAGITTLEELGEADDFDLHARSGLPYTLTCRLAFLARRTLSTPVPAPVPASPGPRDDHRLDAAGPFA